MLRKVLIGMALLLSFALKADDQQARMMVHLLDYIAVDYSMAVEKSKVINMAEYEEITEFAKTVSSLSAGAPPAVISDIELLSNLIQQKAAQEKVSSVANSIKQKVISHYQLKVAPKRWPSLVNGAALFTLHCQSCHGAKGKGDGVLAPGLRPQPTNFHEGSKANGLSPFQAYNTIRLGVDGTAMRAFDELNDDEAWDLAFYVLSLSQEGLVEPSVLEQENFSFAIDLEQLASSNNEELRKNLELSEMDFNAIAALRLYPKEIAEASQGDYLQKAIALLKKSNRAYQAGEKEKARNLALTAYLEGVEPVEAQLRANDASFAADLEMQMATMRSYIEKSEPSALVEEASLQSIEMIREAQAKISEKTFSSWLAFLLSSSIILREGLEAFLVIITILGIIRALKMPRAAKWVHGGWMAAIGLGILLWLAAGRLFTFSGAQRELMEGFIAIFAVGVLLYVGFWMHSKSEAGKWQAYVKERIQGLAKKENMMGLAFLSFLVVFREAFESVLFLSALSLEIGEGQQMAFGGGVVFAFILLFIISVALLRYSKRIPITELFKYSALVISFLAVVLIGKGIHSLQEAGSVSISIIPLDLRLGLLGVYPTWESLLAQLGILILIVLLWNIGNRQNTRPSPRATS